MAARLKRQDDRDMYDEQWGVTYVTVVVTELFEPVKRF